MKKNHLKFELTNIFQFQFSCTNFNGAPNFVIIFSTLETFSTLPQKRREKNAYYPKSKQSVKSDVLYCMMAFVFCLFTFLMTEV